MTLELTYCGLIYYMSSDLGTFPNDAELQIVAYFRKPKWIIVLAVEGEDDNDNYLKNNILIPIS